MPAIPPNYQPPANLLQDRVILVTGASQVHSLGRAAAIAYAAHGATVILHGRDMPKLEAAYDEIEDLRYPQPAIMPLDYLKAKQADLDGFAETIRSTFGRLDGIFHGASHFSPLMPLALQGLEVWQKQLTVNLAVPVALTKACMPLLKMSVKGTKPPHPANVIFLSESHAATASSPGTAYWGPFATAKGALQSVVDIWQAEMLDTDNVHFHLVTPGPVSSPMRHKSHPGELTTSLPNSASLANAFLYFMAEPGNSI